MTIVTVPNRCGPAGVAYLDAAGTFLRGGLACGVRKARLKAHRTDGCFASVRGACGVAFVTIRPQPAALVRVVTNHGSETHKSELELERAANQQIQDRAQVSQKEVQDLTRATFSGVEQSGRRRRRDLGSYRVETLNIGWSHTRNRRSRARYNPTSADPLSRRALAEVRHAPSMGQPQDQGSIQ
jgi:predicted  nucleic acid-binding Zn-ribbon protein